VQSAEMLKQLMDRELVRIAGEDDSLGRPFLYETTRKFLELYGLQTLDDLPMSERLRRVRTETTEMAAADAAEAASPQADECADKFT
jgi:segregation and condensation protein B